MVAASIQDIGCTLWISGRELMYMVNAMSILYLFLDIRNMILELISIIKYLSRGRNTYRKKLFSLKAKHELSIISERQTTEEIQ